MKRGEGVDYTQLNNSELIMFIKAQINKFLPIKEKMQESMNYYNYKHDILKKQRLVIAKDGRLRPINNLPNNKIIDNQFGKVVDQKVNYLFSLPPLVKSEDENYQNEIQSLYDKKFMRTLNKTDYKAVIYGIAWWQIYIKENGDFGYQLIDSKEIVPIWQDNNHESLDALIRKYVVKVIEDGKIKDKIKVDFFTDDIVYHYNIENGDNYVLNGTNSYIQDEEGKQYSFEKIPFIYFKTNGEEPLLNKCKSLQDGINTIISNYQDNMLEDKRNTIMVLKNYDGENLGEFRRNLAQYGAVKVRTADGSQGGVDTLEVNVNSQNYSFILQLLKEKLIENARGIDFKNDRTSQAPNELNIKSMYTDIELDANAMELEFTASLEHLEEFYKQIKNIKTDEVTKIEFKRNIMVNDESLIGMIRNSIGLVSNETLLGKHPLVDNVQEEQEKLKKEQEEQLKDYVMNSLGGVNNELLGKESITDRG